MKKKNTNFKIDSRLKLDTKVINKLTNEHLLKYLVEILYNGNAV